MTANRHIANNTRNISLPKQRHRVLSRWLSLGLITTIFAFTLAACSSNKPASLTQNNAGESESPLPTGLITHSGRWLTDSSGRVLLFHGVNIVAKEAPFTPVADGFSNADAAFLASLGFRVVRVGVLASGLMPTPGQVDSNYIKQIAITVTTLANHGIYSLIDFHQDGWGPSIGSDGFPAWMTVTNGAVNTHASFPLYYIQNPAIQAAFQSFWDNAPGPNGMNLQSDYTEMFSALATNFKTQPYVLGYDLFNEPWPGTVWVPCLSAANGCPTQDSNELDAAYSKVTKAIRAAGDSHLIFGEPFVLFNFGLAPTNIKIPGNDSEAGMAFHDYPATTDKEPNVISNAIAWSQKSGGALLNTEWGATSSAPDILRETQEFDTKLVPWIFWSFDGSVVKNIALPPTGSNVVASTVGSLVQPYALAVAGTPKSDSYDPATKTLTFSYSTDKVTGGSFAPGSVTSFEIPNSIYPGGYSIQVQGGSALSPKGSTACGTGLRSVGANSNAKTVTVVISPGHTCP